MNLNDADRPLNGRGRSAAPEMAKELEKRDWVPDLVLSSNAVRTKETFDRMQEVWDKQVRVEYREELYLASSHILMMAAGSFFDKYKPDTLMILGHNPGMIQLMADIAETFEDQPVPTKFSTAACAMYEGFMYKGSYTADELVEFIKPTS